MFIHSLLEVLLIFVDSIFENGGVHFIILDQNHEGCKQRSANDLDEVQVSLFFVLKLVSVHEFSDGKLKLSFHVSLQEEFLKHVVHPLVEDVSAISDDLEAVTGSQHDGQK